MRKSNVIQIFRNVNELPNSVNTGQWKRGTLLVVAILFAVPDAVHAKVPEGHLLPLAARNPFLGSIEEVDHFPYPKDFYAQFVLGNKPVKFRGVGKNMPCYLLWSDDYLRRSFGEEVVTVEMGKKENRSKVDHSLKFREFLELYNLSDIYMVHDISTAMKEDLLLPRSLQCGGYEGTVSTVVAWFSSGGTKSVLHTDDQDNINCVLDGSKELIFIDRRYAEEVTKDAWEFEGSYSNIDVDSVDLIEAPNFGTVPYYSASVEAGDCIFIPYRWFHTVKSSQSRNLAVNLWFDHVKWLNETDCDLKADKLVDRAPLNSFPDLLATSNSSAHKIRMVLFSSFLDLDEISFLQFQENLDVEGVDSLQLFGEFDSNKDAVLEWREVYSFGREEFLEILEKYGIAELLEWEDLEKEEREREENMKTEKENVKTEEGSNSTQKLLNHHEF